MGETDVEVGQVATLLGDPAKGDPGVGEWSAALDTIDYEITCGLPRLPASTTAPARPGAGRRAIQEAFG